MFSFLAKRFSKFRTPSLLQVEHTECGVVSLAIIFGYYKKWFTIEYLRDACGVSRDGSNALNLLKFAREEGFDAHGYSLELEQLKEMNSFPIILHWKFNHFIVLERIIGKRYWVNDPVSGRQVLDEKEVDESFTGVALTFKPNDSFTRSGTAPSWIKPLMSYAGEIKMGLFLATALGLALVVPGMLIILMLLVKCYKRIMYK